MHIEKNFYENIINIVMNVSGKTKDNVNARLHLEELCTRDELHLRTRENGNSYKPKAKFTLSSEQKRLLCEWWCNVSFLNGYNSNLYNEMDTSFTKLQNMKSHDYHVFMEALLPIAFSGLPSNVLGTLPAPGEFFRNLCANVIREDLLIEMQCNIAIVLCKLKIIFSPEF